LYWHEEELMDVRNWKPSRESFEATRSDVAVDVLRGTGCLRLRVRGESMLPTLWPADEVELAGCRLDDVQPGEIVLAHREGRMFLHRLISCEESGGFVLRGDSMAAPDPPFVSTALVGKLVGVMRGGQMVASRVRSWTRPIGWLLCHCAAARRLVLRLRGGRNLSANLPQTEKAREAHEFSS